MLKGVVEVGDLVGVAGDPEVEVVTEGLLAVVEIKVVETLADLATMPIFWLDSRMELIKPILLESIILTYGGLN